MAMNKQRTTPRPFDLHWGKGQIVEEATYAGEHHELSMQLLEFDDGYVGIRFCYNPPQADAGPFDYAQDRRFQRGPVVVSSNEMDGMRQALAGTGGCDCCCRRW